MMYDHWISKPLSLSPFGRDDVFVGHRETFSDESPNSRLLVLAADIVLTLMIIIINP